MRRHIIALFIVGFSLSFVLYNGCKKDDNPVGGGTGQNVTSIITNGSIVPTNHSQATGSMFVTDQNGNPINEITGSNVTAVLKWGNSDFPADSSSGIITVTSNSQAGSNVAGAITMDLSGSMGTEQIDCMQNGVLAYINSMKTNDVSEIIKFSSDVEVIQTFTNDKNLLRVADTSYWSGTGGSTALYASIYQGTNDAKLQSSNLVRAVIAFTDGGENASGSITNLL